MKEVAVSREYHMRNTRAFTIIEILVVFFIIVIMAALAAPAITRGFRQSRMNTAATAVSTTLRQARNIAIASGEIYCARFVTADPAQVDVHKLGESDIGGVADWNLCPTAGGAMLPEDVVISSPSAFIYFLPDGSAWGPGATSPPQIKVGLSPEHTPVIINGRNLDSRTITVRALTGMPDVTTP